METKGLNQDVIPVYPELSFGFNFDQQFMVRQPLESADGIVREVARAIVATRQESSTEEPMSTEMGSALFNQKKLRRIDNYMAQKVTGFDGCKRRRDLVDIHKAADTVLDELSYSNHPVAQAIGQLYCDYGSCIGVVSLSYVTTEIIKLACWDKLQSVVALQVNTWRLGQSALK